MKKHESNSHDNKGQRFKFQAIDDPDYDGSATYMSRRGEKPGKSIERQMRLLLNVPVCCQMNFLIVCEDLNIVTYLVCIPLMSTVKPIAF
jgi:hypothetical protein